MSNETDQIPELFHDRREYKDIPEALEKAQATFNEELLYQALTKFAEKWYERDARPAVLLDLCSATGLAALRVARAIPVNGVTLVDTDREALKVGAAYFANSELSSMCCTDAVTFETDTKYDLILMNSGYHHIEDPRKVDFLRNAKRLLAPGGEILVGEHFLGPYSNASEFKARVVEFYSLLIEELKRRHEPDEAVGVIRQAAYYCWLGQYEYKVSCDVFLEHCRTAQLLAKDSLCVWPDPLPILKCDFGSFVLALKTVT